MYEIDERIAIYNGGVITPYIRNRIIDEIVEEYGADRARVRRAFDEAVIRQGLTIGSVARTPMRDTLTPLQTREFLGRGYSEPITYGQTLTRPLSTYAHSVSRERAQMRRSDRIAQVRRDYNRVRNETLTPKAREDAFLRLVTPSRRRIDVTATGRDEFLRATRREVRNQIRSFEQGTGTDNPQEEKIVRNLQDEVYESYRRSGTGIATGNLIQSLRVQAQPEDNETRYVLTSDVVYAKRVNVLKGFTDYLNGVCLRLTGTPLYLEFPTYEGIA